MQTLPSSPWPALASGAHLEQQSPGSCPRERLRCISAGRNPSQPHSRTLTQPSPLGNDLIPFPHRSSVALQTIWFSLKPVHNVWANSKGHMTAFISQKLPVLVLETGAAHDSLHLTKTSHSGDRNRGWGLFLLPQGSKHRRDARDTTGCPWVVGWAQGAWGFRWAQRAEEPLPAPPLCHQPWPLTPELGRLQKAKGKHQRNKMGLYDQNPN